MPQLEQIWCGRCTAPQFLHVRKFLALRAWWDLLRFFLELEVRLRGTAIFISFFKIKDEQKGSERPLSLCCLNIFL